MSPIEAVVHVRYPVGGWVAKPTVYRLLETIEGFWDPVERCTQDEIMDGVLDEAVVHAEAAGEMRPAAARLVAVAGGEVLGAVWLDGAFA